MRLTLLFISALSMSAIAHAQHFTDAGNSWTLGQVNWEMQTAYTFQIKIDGDTIIQNQTYKTLLQADDAYNPNWHRLNYYLREDDQKIVYILDSTGHEGILYDFGLDVGQQVVLWNGITATVHSIDSVKVANNQMQRRLMIKATIDTPGAECSSLYPWWIDDIGGTAGPVPFGYCTENDISYGLGCFLRNDEIYFPGENNNWCEDFTSATVPINEVGLNIFPNPVTDILTITFRNGLNHSRNIELYNSQGQMVYHQFTDNIMHQIDMTKMASGVFFLNVISNNHNLICRKIVKL